MNSLADRVGRINPAGIHPYVDKLQIWLREPAPNDDVRMLWSQCGTGGLKAWWKPAKFDLSYHQRLQLRQPRLDALLWAARRNDVLPIGLEISLDWTFETEDERDQAFALVCSCFVKKHHRKQGIRFVGGGDTMYTGPRGAPNVIAVYKDLPSKASGEVYCVHFDWRMNGVNALRQAGVTTVADLLALDYRQFWEKRLLFFGIDPEDLGRRYHNRDRRGRQKHARRTPWIKQYGRFKYEVDRRLGETIVHSLGATQAVIDQFPGRFNLRRSLKPIPVEHLLPSALTVAQSYD